MSTATGPEQKTVPPEEAERRITEYRAIGLKHRSPAIGVYAEEHQSCPWAGCDYLIKGIEFRLDEMGGKEVVETLLNSWWQGPGLVGPCPQCKRMVLFRLTDKRPVDAAAAQTTPRLPDDWARKARILGKGSVRYVRKN